MTVARKYLFEVDFEAVEKPKVVVGEIVEEAEPEVVEPVFKDYHLEESYDAGFEAGLEEGLRNAEKTIEKNVSEILTKMLNGMPDLFTIQKEANASAAHDAMAAALAVSRKILPGLSERNALGEVERMVKMTLEKVIDEPQVVVRVNTDLLDSMSERIETLAKNGNFEGRVLVQADADLQVDACRIEWSSGGADRDMNALWKEIDGIIECNFDNGTEDEPAVEETGIQADGELDTVSAEASVPDDEPKEDAPEEIVDEGEQGTQAETEDS